MLLTKVTSGYNALHWMHSGVLVCGCTCFIAGGAQVVIDANKAFISTPPEVIFQTRITADSCKRCQKFLPVCSLVLYRYGDSLISNQEKSFVRCGQRIYFIVFLGG